MPTPRSSRGEVSLFGLYQGVTPSGAVAIFYVQGNTTLRVHILDTANQAIHSAEGDLIDGAFALTLSNGSTISGTVADATIAASLDGATFEAERVSVLGAEMRLAGRYFGIAHAANGISRLLIQLDSNHHLLMIQQVGSILTGGYGRVERSGGNPDEFTFTLEQVIGGSSNSVTGSFTIKDGVIEGSFTNPAGTFTFNAHKKALAHRLANIATRGLVAPDQGELIGGFIITGGPKLVLIRASGPSLVASGVLRPLPDPALELFSGPQSIGVNDNWKNNPNAAEIAASGMAPTDDLEAALLIRLEEGAYTPVVTGNGNSKGVAVVEIYEIGNE